MPLPYYPSWHQIYFVQNILDVTYMLFSIKCTWHVACNAWSNVVMSDVFLLSHKLSKSYTEAIYCLRLSHVKNWHVGYSEAGHLKIQEFWDFLADFYENRLFSLKEPYTHTHTHKREYKLCVLFCVCVWLLLETNMKSQNHKLETAFIIVKSYECWSANLNCIEVLT